MWIYNSNFGKWSSSDDNIKLDTFNLLKQELSATRFYSRILSGATFIPVNDLDNIYDILGEWEPKNWYISSLGSQYSETASPTNNAMAIDDASSYEYYTKFISEYGMTLKTLFTADRLIKDSISNYYYVDVATTEILDLNIDASPMVIDGVLLKRGHRVLVKDQKTIETLTSDIDPATYFKGSYIVVDDFGGVVTYEYHNFKNGIYEYDGRRLVRDPILDDYSNCIRYSLYVNNGLVNAEKQYHLRRLTNGYFPSTLKLEPIEFLEKHNWMLRNRVDYNNLFEINYYDVIKHGYQSYQIEGVTYSIPPRTISIGEFGVIMNTQNISGIQGTSNILPNKYKSNLRSISQTNTHYWVCGDDSTLLKVRKHDFFIEKVSLDILSALTSISFFNDLRGAVVGEFNTILITTDGGNKWDKVNILDFAPYKYSKVIFTESDRFYIGGGNGVFLEIYEDQSGWSVLKRRIFKEVDDEDEYLLVEGINDLYKTTIDSWGLSYSFGNTQSTSAAKELIFIATNNNNIIVYDTKDATDFDFLYLDFGKDYGDIRNITRQNGTDNFYFTAKDGLYSFDINDFKYIGIGNTYSNAIAGTYATLESSLYANEIFDYEGNELIICGNTSLLKTTNYNPIDFKLLDDGFEDRLKSKLLFMDYDIGAKLNWFTDQGDYRMPNIASFTASDAFSYTGNSRASDYLLEIGFGPIVHGATGPSMMTQSECSWMDYWIDTQKTFEYYSDYPLNEYSVSGLTGSMVLISTTFSYASGELLSGGLPNKKNKISFYKDTISNSYDDISKLAPSFTSGVNDHNGGTYSSRYTKSNLPNISEPASVLSPNGDGTDVKIYLYDYLMILRVPKNTVSSLYSVPKVGDTIRIESTAVDTNLIVNKVWHAPVISGKPQSGKYTYIYMYSEFNQNMITDLILNAGDSVINSMVSVKNLNIYENIEELVNNFNLHTIGNAYELTIVSASFSAYPTKVKNYDLKVTTKFNNLTSYYNLATNIYKKIYTYSTNINSGYEIPMVYTGGFLKFGYTATYNLLDYLESINSDQNTNFYAAKEYLSLPVYKDIPLGSLGSSNIYIDSNGMTQSNTTGNKLLFGESLKLEWQSIMINTFVDVSIYQPSASGTFITERLLVMNKYTIKNIDNLDLDTYVIEFQKKLNFSLGTDFNDGTIDIISRRSLLQISEDLKELNNIHRSKLKTKHIANDTLGYNNYQRELNFKVPTDSYAKAFMSDVDTVNSLSAIMYIDYKNELSMNITKLDRDYNIPIANTEEIGGMLSISCSEKHKLNKYDGVVLEFNGGSASSSELNQQYFGFRVVTEIYNEYDFGVDLYYGNNVFIGNDTGFVKFIKRDPFFNYQPVDLIDIGVNKRGQIAIELSPENTTLKNGVFGLSNVDFSKYRFRLIDGLNIETLSVSYPWMLEAEVSGAVLGLDINGLVWYKGIWEAGRWFDGTWISGTWKYGDWYDGIWNSKTITDKKTSVDIDQKSSDETQSIWYTGRWFKGKWDNGTWINGRFYDGEWNAGVWNNGTWNDGTWNSGRFIGGIWVTGTWNSGIFNTDNDPAYWIDGEWNGGDFENGMWYNGSFESKKSPSRFGTKSYNSRTATWHGGKWISGSFFSKLGSTLDVSEVHKYSIWHTGQWMSGDFYGGIAYNIDFKSGTWHGGILEDIQIIGMNENNNSFILNGIFKFNIGDEFYIIDNNLGNELSVFGSNVLPGKYTVLYTVEDSDNEITEIYVATKISDFSGKFASYKKKKDDLNLSINTNSYVTDTILIEGAQDNIKDVKVKINLNHENKLSEKYVPVAQYKTTPITFPLNTPTGNIIPDSATYPGEPLGVTTGTALSMVDIYNDWEKSAIWEKSGEIYIDSTDPKMVKGIGTYFTKQVMVGSTIYMTKSTWEGQYSTTPEKLVGKVKNVISDTLLEIYSDYVPLVYYSAGSIFVKMSATSKSYYFHDYVYPTMGTNFKYGFRCNTNNESILSGADEFLSQNIIGLRKSDSIGSITLHWGTTPNEYFGPGYFFEGYNLKYITNPVMSSLYGPTYDSVKERVLMPVTRSEISSVSIVSGAPYSISDEIYSYTIEVSEDHKFSTHFGSYNRYDVGMVYNYVINGLDPDKYYYFRVTEVKSSGIGNLKINLKSPNGKVIGLKDFNKGDTDVNMINTVFTFDQKSSEFSTGAPIYQGLFNMDKNYGVVMNSAYRGSITDSDISSLLGLSGVTMSNGDWTLYIENTSGVNLGVLEDWEIQFGYSDRIGAKLYDKSIAIDTGLRIVSNFQSANWKTGIWTNGIFNNGLFESGLWYNGVFNGTWG